MSKPALIALATVTFVALLIGALGVTSLATNTDVIDTPGLTAIPWAAAVALCTVIFAVMLRSALSPPHPSFVSAVWVGLAVVVAYVAGVWIAAVVTGTDAAIATSVVGRLVLGWPALVIGGAGAITAWATIAIARTGTSAPKWPWESADDAE